MKNIILLLSLAFIVPSYGQLTQSSIEHSVSTKEFESIASVLTKLRFNPFRKKAVKFPFQMTFQDFGAIDSLVIQPGFLEAENASHHNLTLFFNRSGNGVFEVNGYEAYMQIDEESKVVIIEYDVTYKNLVSKEAGQARYQIIFNSINQTVGYNYANDPDFFNASEEVFVIGLTVEKQPERDPIWYFGLNGNPNSPGVSQSFEDFEYLDSIPKKNTLYTFSNIATSVGEQSIIDNSRLEKTNNGYRLFTTLENISVELINLNGQVISVANNYGSNYYFITPLDELPSGVYLIKVSEANGKFATYKALF
jgi:hypothetical protein